MKLRCLLIFTIVLVISACKPEDFQENDSLSIIDFEVVGTNESSFYETPEIDPYLNYGEFLAFIQLDNPGLGYEFTLYISSNQSIQDAQVIYYFDCDFDDRDCYESNYFSLQCNFFTDMTNQCGNQRYDLSETLFTIPFSGYIIAEVCHRVENECVISSQRAVFL